MFGKKKIEAVSVLDLRNYTPQALRKISSIQAVSTILLPENPSPAFAEAYADITKGAIAQEVFAPMDKVAQYNGLNVLGSTLPEGAICLCNGMTIFRRAAGEKHARVFLSGIGVAEQGTGLVIENLNGMFRELDRDLDHLHQFSAELRAGADLLSRLEDGAVIVEDEKIPAGCTDYSLTLTGSGTKEYDLYINGEKYVTQRVNFDG